MEDDARLLAAARRVGPAAEALVARLDRHLDVPEGDARDQRICADGRAHHGSILAVEDAIPLGGFSEELWEARGQFDAASDELSWGCNDYHNVENSLARVRVAALVFLERIPEAARIDRWSRASQLAKDACAMTTSLRARGSRRRVGRASETVRLLQSKSSMPECRGLATAEAVCGCLARLAGNGASCELAELRTARGRLAYVRQAEPVDGEVDGDPARETGGREDERGGEDDELAEPRGIVAGTLLYLLAETGAGRAPSWSALALADASDLIDLAETPRKSSSVEVVHFEELPVAAGTLFWLQSENDVVDHVAGDLDESGESNLLLCTIPARAGVSGTCYAPLLLAAWRLTGSEFDDGDRGDESCTSPDHTAYRFALDATGRGTRSLMRGKDDEKRVGTYQLR